MIHLAPVSRESKVMIPGMRHRAYHVILEATISSLGSTTSRDFSKLTNNMTLPFRFRIN